MSPARGMFARPYGVWRVLHAGWGPCPLFNETDERLSGLEIPF